MHRTDRTITTLAASLAALLVTGGAAAVGTGGYHHGGSGTDLQALHGELGCLCYGYGTGYGAEADAGGNVHVFHGYHEHVSHGTPPTTGPEVGFDVDSGRWLDVRLHAMEPRAEVRSGGGGWVNMPGPSEGGVANQGIGLGDVRADASGQGGVSVHVSNAHGGSAVQDMASACLALPAPGGPGGAGFYANYQLYGFPVGAHAGFCGKPG